MFEVTLEDMTRRLSNFKAIGLLPSHISRLRYFAKICGKTLYGYFKKKVKVTFEMLAVRRQQHSFSTHERMFLWKCQSFWDRKCLYLRGTRTPNLRIHAECYNHLSYQGQTFAVPFFLTLALVSGYLVFILCYFQYILCQCMCVFVMSLSYWVFIFFKSNYNVLMVNIVSADAIEKIWHWPK